MINFACISPHPPIILPTVGSDLDRKAAGKTIQGLMSLEGKMAAANPSHIVISSPHPEWGFNVPLFFLVKNTSASIDRFLTQEESADEHYRLGKEFYFAELKSAKQKIALVASGDLSHRLKKDGPYGLHHDAANFDRTLIANLKNKNVDAILGLDEKYPNAGECGLRSICFILGILIAANIKWEVKIISYEGPFGVGYLVSDLMG